MSQTATPPRDHAAVIIRVNGMTSNDAATAIRERLLEVEGVLAVRMNIADPSARVEYQPSKQTPISLSTIIGQMGYGTTIRSMLRTM